MPSHNEPSEEAIRIAEAAMPGWRVVRSPLPAKVPLPNVRPAPDIEELRKKYFGNRSSPPPAPASPAVETSLLTLESQSTGPGPRRRVVLVRGSRIIGFQG